VSGVPEGSLVVLIRHSTPEIDPSRPAREWALSAEGRGRARQLAAYLERYDLRVLASSEEHKAVQTAHILGEELGLSVEVVPGLHEQERSDVGRLDREAFLRGVAQLFAHPNERLFGAESADEARARFSDALGRLLTRYPEHNVGVVTHGTVLSLYVAAREGSDAYALWQGLGLPCAAILSRPELRLVEWVGEPTDRRLGR
jgi:broad specificity phosphatase PhoE